MSNNSNSNKNQLISTGFKKFESKEKEYFYYKSLIKSLIDKKAKDEQKYFNSMTALENEIPLYIKHVKSLDNEITGLKLSFHRNVTEPFLEKQKEMENDQDNIDFKKIFKMISSKCHPDKTDDSEKHDLFIAAKDAYKNSNFSLLTELYEAVTNNILNVISIDRKLELIKNEYTKIKQEYDELLNSQKYRIYKLYDSEEDKNRYTARKVFLNLVFDQILELETLKEQLLQQSKTKQ